ncbi:Uncharacterized membrane protein YjgN, DUF898 family [Roseovarius nanhaiticus]|uniref:Uncharacterized membrane protein YjgN, DUF898 family n=1 Tax=Roseovarius nanhaiticus TaxID=573024 RepID=A0A1N7FX01_9RHOB|nr:DUF898 family protein [Roseovarius nanhaiticus]SEK43152.1 Uncharacterized membrane protein YjgN, DUF898 family [Roseovarius nanhaiticus]SIS04862.1 Uncharacterized membrane protein YjgN, DUF898 family [Roseovarius nanhaiticus]
MSTALNGEYHGKAAPLFWLGVRTAMLTAVTLGIYRFWAKTRIRRHIWSSVAADGDAFEYTGTGLEKFLGFLAAIVILALYLGAVQMVLFYFGLSLFGTAETQAQAFLQFGALSITSIAVLPLIFFAQYRARRYQMGRTRWRGVRFGVLPGAWGYVWRAMAHWAVTILSLGLLWPRMTFCLEKYKVDRSWYGDAPFHQGGRWQELYPAMKHLFIGAGLMVLSVIFGFAEVYVMAGLWGALGVVWALVGILSYRVNSFAYLARHLTLGDGRIGFDAAPETWAILWQIVGGSLLVSFGTGLAFAILGLIPAALAFMEVISLRVLIVPTVLAYLLAMAISSSLYLTCVAQPVLRHVTARCRLTGADALGDVRQREADGDTDAEGFADALDIGGAF